MAPIDVSDVGAAVAIIALAVDQPPADKLRIYELGGQQTYRVLEYLRVLRGKPAKWQIEIPVWIARPVSHLFDLLHFSPFSFGHYQLLQFDNCPTINRIPELLGRAATPISSPDEEQSAPPPVRVLTKTVIARDERLRIDMKTRESTHAANAETPCTDK